MGTRLGRYDILRTLFKGELTDLLLARRDGMEGFQRHVAIKRLHAAHASDKSCLDAFVNEARLAAALHHHNVVQVLDIGEDAGQPYFAMEYVHGVDLRALLNKLSKRNEQLPMQHVVSIIAAAAAALHHAHEQKGPDGKPLGIVHRDVTPSNIIVGFDGNVKVVDFGIAKAAIRRISTDQGVLKGRVPYMAPEQCAGKTVDRRSDVFALGVVAFELATVRRLFKGANEFLTMSAIVNAEIPKPSQFRTDIPPELEQIMLKALARNPLDRYPTAGAMALALDQVAVKVGVGASTTQLASYMRLQFGNVKEPWLEGSDFVDGDSETTDVDFDGAAAGLAPPAAESVRDHAIPKSIAATRSSPIAQVHARSAATPTKPSEAVAEAAKGPVATATVSTNTSPEKTPAKKATEKPKKTPIDKSYSVATDVEAVSYDRLDEAGDTEVDDDDEHVPTTRAPRKSNIEIAEATDVERGAATEATEIVAPLPVMPTERPVVRRATSRIAPKSGGPRTVLWIFAALVVVALVAGAVVMWPGGKEPTQTPDETAEAARVPSAAQERPAHEDSPSQPAHDDPPTQPPEESATQEAPTPVAAPSGMNATMADYSGTPPKPDDRSGVSDKAAKSDNAKPDDLSGVSDKGAKPGASQTALANTSKAESAKAETTNVETTQTTKLETKIETAKPAVARTETSTTTEKTDIAKKPAMKVAAKPDTAQETAKPAAAKVAKRTPPKSPSKPTVTTKRPTAKATAKKPTTKKPGKWNPDDLFLGD